jgi:predicted ATPase
MLRYLRGTPRAKLLEELIPERQWVYDVLRGVRLLGKTAIRQTYIRRPCLLQVSRQRISPTSNVFPGKLDRLVRKIFRMKTEELNEFESICQRIGLARKITIEKFILSEALKERAENENEKYIISVLLDGVNIGLLSDGTLRVLSLIIELIDPPPSVTTIIEEPETQIHPGMLAKLLNEIDTYTFGQNLILSTHSPQVVGWSSPDKINLVYRNHGQTIVRKLDEEEIQKVVEYLHEEGDLGEWLYSGIFDD